MSMLLVERSKFGLNELLGPSPATPTYGAVGLDDLEPSSCSRRGARSLPPVTGVALAHMSVAGPPSHCSYGSVLMVAKSAHAAFAPVPICTVPPSMYLRVPVSVSRKRRFPCRKPAGERKRVGWGKGVSEHVKHGG